MEGLITKNMNLELAPNKELGKKRLTRNGVCGVGSNLGNLGEDALNKYTPPEDLAHS